MIGLFLSVAFAGALDEGPYTIQDASGARLGFTSTIGQGIATLAGFEVWEWHHDPWPNSNFSLVPGATSPSPHAMAYPSESFGLNMVGIAAIFGASAIVSVADRLYAVSVCTNSECMPVGFAFIENGGEHTTWLANQDWPHDRIVGSPESVIRFEHLVQVPETDETFRVLEHALVTD
ncbi:MAG: hypothetical protein AAGA48_13655 [Myxococcota bacterium]